MSLYREMSYDTASEDAFGTEHDIFSHIFVSPFLSDCTEHRRLGFFLGFSVIQSMGELYDVSFYLTEIDYAIIDIKQVARKARGIRF